MFKDFKIFVGKDLQIDYAYEINNGKILIKLKII